MIKNQLANKLEECQYTFAKTMQSIPHSYCLRKKVNNNILFNDLVLSIRKHGVKEFFKGKSYIYFYANGYKYWTMGSPVSETILINRAHAEYKTSYDNLDKSYTSYFQSDIFKQENEYIKNILNLKGKVLDVGCGMGLPFPVFNLDYTGVDISKQSLNKFTNPLPNKLVNCSFSDFYSTDKFDFIISLFGSASYLKKGYLKKMKNMLKPNGVIFLMFYAKGYTPVTYNVFSVSEKPNFIKSADEILFGKYAILKYTNS